MHLSGGLLGRSNVEPRQVVAPLIGPGTATVTAAGKSNSRSVCSSVCCRQKVLTLVPRKEFVDDNLSHVVVGTATRQYQVRGGIVFKGNTSLLFFVFVGQSSSGRYGGDGDFQYYDHCCCCQIFLVGRRRSSGAIIFFCCCCRGFNFNGRQDFTGCWGPTVSAGRVLCRHFQDIQTRLQLVKQHVQCTGQGFCQIESVSAFCGPKLGSDLHQRKVTAIDVAVAAGSCCCCIIALLLEKLLQRKTGPLHLRQFGGQILEEFLAGGQGVLFRFAILHQVALFFFEVFSGGHLLVELGNDRWPLRRILPVGAQEILQQLFVVADSYSSFSFFVIVIVTVTVTVIVIVIVTITITVIAVANQLGNLDRGFLGGSIGSQLRPLEDRPLVP
mmetsp:Transcript_27428/g.60373  ORF Transcript_27428/g.60373 Transcript_27428/m.60373 type:complete len:385 (-) Transcript_27428:644-1798(-)